MQKIESLKPKFLLNKFIFAAYTGSKYYGNMSRWHVLKPQMWSNIRHQLESFGIESLEEEALGLKTLKYDGQPHSNTIIRGYMVWEPMRKYTDFPPKLLERLNSPSLDIELKSESFPLPNSFILLVRMPMPLGGKAFVPIHEQSKYALLQNAKETSELEAMKEKQLHRFHACDRPVRVSEISASNAQTYEYLEPPPDYLCSSCNKIGHHYKEACFIWPKIFSSGDLLCGAKKFGSAQEMKDDDAKQFSIMYRNIK
jgi:hypothetical protein